MKTLTRPEVSRAKVLERLDQNNQLILKALDKAVQGVRSATGQAKEVAKAQTARLPKVNVPKVDLPKVPVPAVVEENVEFARTIVRKQAEFVSQAVRTVTGEPAPAKKTAKKSTAKKSTAKKSTAKKSAPQVDAAAPAAAAN